MEQLLVSVSFVFGLTETEMHKIYCFARRAGKTQLMKELILEELEMSKVDKTKIYQTSLKQQDMALDKMPSKRTKKAKAKMRQHGKKEIRKENV